MHVHLHLAVVAFLLVVFQFGFSGFYRFYSILLLNLRNFSGGVVAFSFERRVVGVSFEPLADGGFLYQLKSELSGLHAFAHRRHAEDGYAFLQEGGVLVCDGFQIVE